MYTYHLYGLMHGEHRYAYLCSVPSEPQAQARMHALTAYKDIIILERRICLNLTPTAFLDQQSIIVLTNPNPCGCV